MSINEPSTHSASLALLNRAHSPTTASEIHKAKIANKPLLLRPSSPPPANAREQRRREREKKAEKERKKRGKPRPLSAKQKRETGVHDFRKEELKWNTMLGLNKMWGGYIRGVLGLEGDNAKQVITPQDGGTLLASAEFVGARFTVVRCNCVSRVGVEGIVIRDTKGSFVVVTEKQGVKILPKEKTVFGFEISMREGTEEKEQEKALRCELYGDQFITRPADRSKRLMKVKIMKDL
ncbi:ribonuclease P complex subunit Pop4 [Aulographum hederae CBS 113979]|uniref:Ribonuclease P protein subunit n=1 Tax=Aulographum hederae CBS 113979 TaxID=1176131 RepID=A0A6G1HC04_9PEZI|nr:ribonuclease P complex subunit Pop4 [Aulographum hederae CBS 113979]